MPSLPRLTWRTKLIYGLGQASEGLKTYAFEVFLFFFYTRVAGLESWLAGLSLFVALLFDAVSDPLVGVLSDRYRGRLGRRHPFMYAAALPLALTFAAVFSPPASLDGWQLFTWMTVTSSASRLALTLFIVPHLSLGAELSEEDSERTALVGYRLSAAVLGAVLCSVAAWQLFFSEGGENSRDAYREFGIATGVCLAVICVLSALGTQRLGKLVQPPPERGAHADLVQRLLKVANNRHFRPLFLAVLLFFATRGVQLALDLHMFKYFWHLTGEKIQWIQAAQIGALALGIPMWSWLMQRYDKRLTLTIGIALFSVLQSLPVMARLAGTWPIAAEESWRALCLTYGLAGACAGAGFVGVGTMMADVADAHQHATGERSEGIFFGASTFARKSSSGFGALAAGVLLSSLGVSIGSDQSAMATENTWNMAFAYGPVALVLSLLVIPILTHYKLDAGRHEAISIALGPRTTRRSLV